MWCWHDADTAPSRNILSGGRWCRPVLWGEVLLLQDELVMRADQRPPEHSRTLLMISALICLYVQVTIFSPPGSLALINRTKKVRFRYLSNLGYFSIWIKKSVGMSLFSITYFSTKTQKPSPGRCKQCLTEGDVMKFPTITSGFGKLSICSYIQWSRLNLRYTGILHSNIDPCGCIDNQNFSCFIFWELYI